VDAHEKRERDALKTFASHTISERTLIDNMRASFVLRPPPEVYGHYVEIQAARWGNLIVYGDWQPVVFGGGAWHHWRGAIHWIGQCSSSGYYPAQKARIGTGIRFTEWDEDEARRNLCSWRRAGMLERDEAREAWDGIGEDEHASMEALYEATSDCELLTDTLNNQVDPRSEEHTSELQSHSSLA
jgi:hypothetical protein